jgi:tetratricopeptide (TPR) repeat protein
MLRTFVLFLLTGICFAEQTSAPTAIDLVKQGEKLNSEGKQDDALALYRKVLEMSPNLYEAHLACGIALDLKANYVEARRHFVKAIEFATPDSKQQALRAMAMSYAFGGNTGESAKFEQQVIDARMSARDYIGAAEISNELARIYLESGNTIDAYKWYESR